VFERFTDRARRVLVLAQNEALLLKHSYIGTEHILLGLMDEGEGVAARALAELGISLEVSRQKVEETIGLSGSAPTGSPQFTWRAKKVLELSLREALQLGHDYIGTEHILLGVVRERHGVACQVLISLGVDLDGVRRQVLSMLPDYQGKMLFSETEQDALVECSFCGRLPSESGRIISGRGGASICQHCIAELSSRRSQDDDEGKARKGS
jgi:ATP-dependent Clp protease ATP-binding subunit ClpC